MSCPYRAVDSNGNTLEFVLSPKGYRFAYAKRDKKAAKRFFKKALKTIGSKQPKVVNVDKNPAYSPAIEELKQEALLSTDCKLRQEKYLNNIIEQDHRFPRSRFEYGHILCMKLHTQNVT